MNLEPRELWDREMRELCELRRWQMLDDDLDAPFSPFIRRIVDERGRRRILKVGIDSAVKAREADVLRAFRASGRVPKVTVLAEEGLVMLIKDLGGLTLNVAQRADERYIWRAAKLVRRLHRLPAPEWVLPMSEFLRISYLPNLRRFSTSHDPAHREAARRTWPVLDQLAAGPCEQRFLHGDFHLRNVIVAKGKLWAIDPFGLRGDRAYDLAVLAGHCDDPLHAAGKLAERYGDPLPRFDAWMVIGCYAAYSHYVARGENADASLQALRWLTPGR
jgi:streptomycin 6-kinase